LLGSYFWLFSKDAPPRIGFTRSPWKIFPVTATNASGICDKACILALVSPLGHFKIVAWKHEDITKYPSFQKTRNYQIPLETKTKSPSEECLALQKKLNSKSHHADVGMVLSRW